MNTNFKKWAIAMLMVFLTMFVMGIIQAILDKNLDFLSGWFSCAAYFITILYLNEKEKEKSI